MKKSGTCRATKGNPSTLGKIFIACSLALLCLAEATAAPPPGGFAPIVVPAGGFGIDGDLLSGSPEAGIGDWVAGPSGGGVLSATGAPLNPATTFHFIDLSDSTSDRTFGGGLKWTDDPNT
ncbi:MAG TPA: hypothetical protein VJA21_01780 [Verrucomicrobiae bacterium]